MSAPEARFPVRLLAPVAISTAATGFVKEIEPWTLVTVGAAIVLRLIYRALRFEPASSRFWLALSISIPSVATAWLAMRAHDGGAAGPALVSVASVLLALALAGPPTSGALSRIVGLSLAQIAGAAVLEPGRSMSIACFVYVAVLVPVLVRLASTLVAPRRGESTASVRRVAAEGARRRSPVPGALRFLVAAIPLGVWFFVALPHREAGSSGGTGPSSSGGGIGAGFTGGGSRPGAGESPLDSFVSGAKTSMRLGFVSRVQKNQKPVLLMQVDAGVRGPEPWTLRGLTYDVFTGVDWSRSFARVRGESAVPDSDGWVGVRKRDSAQRLYALRIEDVSGDDTSQLFLAPEAVRVKIDARAADRRVSSAPDGTLSATGGLPRSAVYEEEVELASTDRSRTRGRRCDASIAPWPQTVAAPPEVERYREFARKAVEGRIDPAERAERIEAWLAASFTYTTEMPSIDAKRPVLDFLTRLKRGHCEYFASSMVLLMRSLGHPARLAVGFRGGDYLTSLDRWSFRGNHAHAWCEVYFEGLGWVLYDPTPGLDTRGDRTTADEGETPEPSFLERVLRFSKDDRKQLAAAIASAFSAVAAALSGTSAWGLWPIVGLVLAILLGFLWRRRARARAVGAVDGAGHALGPYGVALQLLGRAGLSRRDTEAAGEFVGRVIETVPGAFHALNRLTHIHESARFGLIAATAADVAAAHHALAQLRTALASDRAPAASAAMPTAI